MAQEPVITWVGSRKHEDTGHIFHCTPVCSSQFITCLASHHNQIVLHLLAPASPIALLVERLTIFSHQTIIVGNIPEVHGGMGMVLKMIWMFRFLPLIINVKMLSIYILIKSWAPWSNIHSLECKGPKIKPDSRHFIFFLSVARADINTLGRGSSWRQHLLAWVRQAVVSSH